MDEIDFKDNSELIIFLGNIKDPWSKSVFIPILIMLNSFIKNISNKNIFEISIL